MKTHKKKHSEFRHFLQNELDLRKGNNPYYSLRSFALSLQIDSSSLSKILNGKRALGKNLIKKLSTKLNLSQEDLNYFLNDTKNNQKKIESLSIDSFLIISRFHHFALLEAIELEGYTGNNKWLADKIHITEYECLDALQRLKRLDLIELRNNRWAPTTDGLLSTYDKNFSNDAHRKLQITILKKAIEALEITPIEKRHQATLTFSLDSQKIPEIIKRIDLFRKELVSFICEGNDKKDSIYNFGQFLYPITHFNQKSKDTQK